MPGYRISARKGLGCQLPALITLLLLSGLAALVSVLFWRLHYSEGFSWSSQPSLQFSWHPLLMSSSLVCSGLGSIMYRVTPCLSRSVPTLGLPKNSDKILVLSILKVHIISIFYLGQERNISSHCHCCKPSWYISSLSLFLVG